MDRCSTPNPAQGDYIPLSNMLRFYILETRSDAEPYQEITSENDALAL